MTPATFANSTNSISLAAEIPFITKKTNYLSRCTFPRKLHKQPFILPLSTSLKLFPQFRIGSHLKPKHRTNATGTDVVVGEVDLSVTESPVTEADAAESSTPQVKRTRPGRKSEMPPVKNEELIPGSTFPGKVRSIQPFGAFVDFGAFTDGLVHVSQLSDSFVKDVASVVTVGQEVKVKLVEVNMETGRISLTMREKEATSMKDTPGSGGGGDKSRPPRRTNQKKDDIKNSKFSKGQDLDGTVKNTTRAGAFISLPEGEEGFLPASEEAEEGFGNMMGGGSSLEIGQEVKVRVLRFSRGKVTLTMKKEEAAGELDAQLKNQGVIHTATNPFMLAFRSNKDISTFLDEREKEKVIVEKEEENVEETKGLLEVEASSVILNDEITEEPSSTEAAENDVADTSSDIVEEASEEAPSSAIENNSELSVEVTNGIVSDVSEEILEKAVEDVVATDEDQIEKPEESDAPGDINDQVVSAVAEEDLENKEDDVIPTVEEELGPEENGSIESSSSSIETPGLETTSTKVEVSGEDSETVENIVQVAEVEVQTSADTQNGTSSDTSPKETTTKAAISPALVKQLREETGAGMMDCKKALSETGGDIAKALEYLRKKGLASADKKASRATSQGRIGSYIHDSRIGILIEVNCETDFVARGDIFKELVDDLAMQVAASPQVQYLTTDDIPKEVVEKEKAIEMQKEDLLSKPEQFRSKIVEGRISKMLAERALLEQPFIKDDKVSVKDWVKNTISTIGENMKVSRFVRYNLGEGLEKKTQDFAAEVAAQTVAKPVSVSLEKEPAVNETKELTEAPAKVVISAALVKQLREETGAGMMDCKKALAESGGDIEKAQEYLRKKGLSTADKKSSRIAAEGRIGSYIHDSRIGVLIEVNCETDFASRSQNFKELVDDLAMQVVACPQVQYVSIEDIPESIVSKEKELEMQREDLQSKPESIREKIVEGRIGKRLGEISLLEQPFIKNDTLLVKDFVKQTVASIGENIKVRRFVRFTLGESEA